MMQALKCSLINQNRKKRDSVIDIARGITIIFVVIGHSMFLSPYVGLFHVSVFFYLSGRLYNEKNTESVEQFLKMIYRRIKGLYLPFVVYGITFVCLHNFFYKIHFYNTPDLWGANKMQYYMHWSDYLKDIVKTLCFANIEQLLAPFWFLPVLFLITIQFGFISFVIKKAGIKNGERIRTVIVTGFFFIACIVNWKTSFILRPIQISWMGMFFYGVGVLVQKWLKENQPIYNIYAAVICFIYLLVSKLYGNIGFAALEISSPGFFLTCSAAGIYLTMFLSYQIARHSRKAKYLFCVIGRSTIEIMGLQYVSFKLVSLILIAIYQYPIYYLAYPVIACNYLWQTVYMLAGVLLPVGFRCVKDQVYLVIREHRPEKR